jgi:hypothetical protein
MAMRTSLSFGQASMPAACSTARVISLTARPREATSRRTVIE